MWMEAIMEVYGHLIGIALCCIGILTITARLFGWERIISQRQAAMDRFGATAGDLVHFVSYSVLPIVFGLILINNHYGLF